MSYIETNPIKNSTIIYIYSERDRIKLDPLYQRMGGVWTKEKKQLLIDSILNDYDIPKIYFHEFDRDKSQQTGFDYAVIDGRQRLEAIWGFIDGDFNLADDFDYQRDSSLALSSLGYEDIAKEYPRIKIKFDSFVLPVISVATEDEDLIEDMFFRLNEAVPLNAAEKRNAIGGDMVEGIRTVSENNFFKTKVAFKNNRFQHREVAARILLLLESIENKKQIIDTKKIYLDALAKNYREGKSSYVNSITKTALDIFDEMAKVFSNKDDLLRSQGNITIYFLLFKAAIYHNQLNLITRRKFIDFNEELKLNRVKATKNYEESSFELLEYDRLTQQGTNDASNIKERVNTLLQAFGINTIHI